MGVSGCGKSSIGAHLARRLGTKFIEGDSYHSAANIFKMASGRALTDDDRAPWLRALRTAICDANQSRCADNGDGEDALNNDASNYVDASTLKRPRLLEMPSGDADTNIKDTRVNDVSCVLACSALKARYRRVLSGDDCSDDDDNTVGSNVRVVFVFLDTPMHVIAARLARRDNHFFDNTLLASQFEALERPPTKTTTLTMTTTTTTTMKSTAATTLHVGGGISGAGGSSSENDVSGSGRDGGSETGVFLTVCGTGDETPVAIAAAIHEQWLMPLLKSGL
jgi:carbohydrate kinase (thermoresistant glucokinase family)